MRNSSYSRNKSNSKSCLSKVLTFTKRRWAICNEANFVLFIKNCTFVCQQKPFVIVLVKLKRKFPSNRCFIGCLIWISVPVLFHDIFCTEATFGQKWLKNSIFHYDFIILESTESRFPIPFVSISNHRSSFCLLLWTFRTAQLEYICTHAPTYNPSLPLENAQNDFKLNCDIHIHVLPMSNLYTLRGNDLRTIGSHYKFTQSKMQFCPYRGKGPCMRKCVFV